MVKTKISREDTKWRTAAQWRGSQARALHWPSCCTHFVPCMQITKDKVLCILLCAGLGGLYNAHQNYHHTGHDLTHRWSFSFVQTFTQCAWMVCIHHAVTALCCSITSHISSHVEGIGLCCNPRLFPSEASCSIFMKSGSKVEGLSDC